MDTIKECATYLYSVTAKSKKLETKHEYTEQNTREEYTESAAMRMRIFTIERNTLPSRLRNR